MVIRLVKVHENGHLLEKCIALLNEEWPRDPAKRRQTLLKSSDRFKPLCLALIEADEAEAEAEAEDNPEKVIGFVKLTTERSPFDRRSAACTVFLESLVVARECRGRGHGRFIMEEVERMLLEEEEVKEVKLEDGRPSVERINLTTIDKERFYEKLGFRRVTPASAVFAEEQQPTTQLQSTKTSQQEEGKDASSLVCSHLPTSLPPPPPPPPPMFTSSKITKQSAANHLPAILMYKNIKQQ